MESNRERGQGSSWSVAPVKEEEEEFGKVAIGQSVM
jgi:hypothetical protein